MPDLPPITQRDVNAAIEAVRSTGIPKTRRSTKFCLTAGNSHLPPKYVVALAAKRSLGRELEPSEFSGGAQTNQLLTDLGFEIRECGCGGGISALEPNKASKTTPKTKARMAKPSKTSKRVKSAERDPAASETGLLSGLERVVSKLETAGAQGGAKMGLHLVEVAAMISARRGRQTQTIVIASPTAEGVSGS